MSRPQITAYNFIVNLAARHRDRFGGFFVQICPPSVEFYTLGKDVQVSKSANLSCPLTEIHHVSVFGTQADEGG